jgi:hypothetical protein
VVLEIKGGLMVRCRFLFVFFLVSVMTGCAGHEMALTKGQTNIDVTKKSLALLSVKISNRSKPDYQLDIIGALICPQSETCGHGSRKHFHSIKSPYKIKSVENSFNEYLLSFELESGTYNVHSMGAVYDHFPITGGGPVPLNYELKIKPNSIIYLGHLDVVMRERKNDSEQRAGPFRPLLDQSPAVGAYTGTYDVVVEDKFEEDMKLFIAEYPILQKVKIEKSILPQWIRPENQPAK